MVRPPRELVEAAREWVCVRVTDMRGVDLSTYRFDYDLTIAFLLMNADGHVYHRYGTRDHTRPTAWLTMTGLVRLMQQTLPEHRAYASKGRQPPPARAARTIADIPAFAAREKTTPIPCVHCHFINDFEHRQAVEDGAWTRDRVWRWPAPDRIGITLDREDQTLVRAVAAGSPAAAAGLAVGDRLIRAEAQQLLTISDLQFVLETAPAGETPLHIAWRRGETDMSARLALAAGWKRGTPLDLSWRPSKWPLRPAPGFGGPLLRGDDLTKLGLPAGTFAFRINYFVDWGPGASVGRNAKRAGLLEGDVVLSVAGESAFETVDHFHAWYRLTRTAGEKVEVLVLREGSKRTIVMEVVE